MAGYINDNSERISKALARSLNAGLSRVDKNLKATVSKLNGEIAGLRSKYNPVRNQLTSTYKNTARANEEYIANTGNHTASGYALSKRMKHTDAYNKNLNAVNLAQANEESELRNKIREARSEAASERERLRAENAEKRLAYQMDEIKRVDDLTLQYEKHNENKRMNDAQISRIEVQNQSEADKNKRDNAEHEVYMRYYPEKLAGENESINAKTENTKANTQKIYADTEKTKADTLKTQADIAKVKAETLLTEAKTETEKNQKLKLAKDIEYTDAQIYKLKSTPVSAPRSSGGSGGGKTGELLSKMTPKDLAENILEQTGTLTYSHTGAPYYENNKEQAAILLLEWKKKFNLSKQVVNDTAIHLGIQGYI